jgi:hypothetical protein
LPDASDGAFAHKLAEMSCDPIRIIAQIACDEAADLRLRFYAAKELAAYLMGRARRDGNPPHAVDVGAIIARAWAASGPADTVEGENP